MEPLTEAHILYQDKSIIVINKPVSLAIHKNDFMARDADYVLKQLGDLLHKRIYNIHRLDAKTSGVLVLAFSSADAALVSKQFEGRDVSKTYYAVVRENPGEGIFDSPVVDKTKKRKVNAQTRYRTIQSIQTSIVYRDFENIQMSLVEIHPDTGRWHQIRQHLAQKRFDIIGDTHHGDFALNRIVMEQTGVKRLLLHAGKLELVHPYSREEMVFEAPIPPEFNMVMDYFREVAIEGLTITESPKPDSLPNK